MFRREAHPEVFPDWIYRSLNWDWVLHILQSANGDLGFIDIETLAYRRHANAAFLAKSDLEILLNGIATLSELNKYLNYDYDSVFKNLWWEHRELSFAYLKQYSWVRFLYHYGKYLLSPHKTGEYRIKEDIWRIKKALIPGKKD